MGKTIVYAADITALSEPQLFAEAYAAVSPERREKADRYKFDNGKYLSLGAELLLRYGLLDAGYKSFPLSFSLGNNGKPYLKDGGIYFSISHSDNWAVCAVSDCELGCDIEKIRPVDLKLSRRFTAKERDDIMSANPDEQLGLFFRCWTLKESFMKATGLGLSLPLNEFQIVMGDEISVIQSVDERSFSFREFDEIRGFKCAVCAAGDCRDAELKIIDLGELIGKTVVE